MQRNCVTYPKPNVVYVDVDGTLLINSRVNQPLVRWVRAQHSEGKQIVVWSARGVGAAIMAVDACGIKDIVSHTLSKPGYVVDDLGKKFTQYMDVINVKEIDGRKNSVVHKRKTRQR